MSCPVQAEDVTVRPAQHADYTAVMDINKTVFFGNDYLHITYHDFIRDSRTYSFVAVVSDTVVGFSCFYTDGPKRIIGVGSRVCADYRGTVVYKKLITTGIDFMKANFPYLEQRVFVAYDSDFYSDEKKHGTGSHPIAILERWHTPAWKVSRSKVMDLLNNVHMPSTSQKIQRLAPEEAISVLTDATNQRQLFPNGHVVGYYNWLPQLLTPSNIRRFVFSHRCRFTIDSASGRVPVVSFSTPHKIPDGTLCCVHYYHSDNDTNNFVVHALDHLAHAVEVTPPGGDIVISLRTPYNVDMDKVKELFMPYLGKARSDTDYKMGTGVCAEARMQPSVH